MTEPFPQIRRSSQASSLPLSVPEKKLCGQTSPMGTLGTAAVKRRNDAHDGNRDMMTAFVSPGPGAVMQPA